MRRFIVILATASTVTFSTVDADNLDDLRKRVGHDPEKADDQTFVAVEVAADAQNVLPANLDFESREKGEDDDQGHDGFVAVELAQFSEATHLDVAGVERSAAGRPIDAQPGSMDAALTGMQHDAGGTVRNTVSPEPTESRIVADAIAKDPALEEQPTPKAAQATTR